MKYYKMKRIKKERKERLKRRNERKLKEWKKRKQRKKRMKKKSLASYSMSVIVKKRWQDLDMGNLCAILFNQFILCVHVNFFFLFEYMSYE